MVDNDNAQDDIEGAKIAAAILKTILKRGGSTIGKAWRVGKRLKDDAVMPAVSHVSERVDNIREGLEPDDYVAKGQISIAFAGYYGGGFKATKFDLKLLAAALTEEFGNDMAAGQKYWRKFLPSLVENGADKNGVEPNIFINAGYLHTARMLFESGACKANQYDMALLVDKTIEQATDDPVSTQTYWRMIGELAENGADTSGVDVNALAANGTVYAAKTLFELQAVAGIKYDVATMITAIEKTEETNPILAKTYWTWADELIKSGADISNVPEQDYAKYPQLTFPHPTEEGDIPTDDIIETGMGIGRDLAQKGLGRVGGFLSTLRNQLKEVTEPVAEDALEPAPETGPTEPAAELPTEPPAVENTEQAPTGTTGASATKTLGR